MCHILISLSEGASNYTSATITQQEAKDLGTVINYLTDENYTFSQIAEKLSSDGSKDKGGDVGIMTTTTSFVNGFKLGLYAYDALYSGRTENTAIENGLGLSALKNLAIDSVNGEFISFLNSGDSISKKTLFSVFKTFDDNLNIDVISIPIYYGLEKQNHILNYNHKFFHYKKCNLLSGNLLLISCILLGNHHTI